MPKQKVDWHSVRRREPGFGFTNIPLETNPYQSVPLVYLGGDSDVDWREANIRIVDGASEDRIDVEASFKAGPPHAWKSLRKAVTSLDLGALVAGLSGEERIKALRRMKSILADMSRYGWKDIRDLIVLRELERQFAGLPPEPISEYYISENPLYEGLHACMWVKWVNAQGECAEFPDPGNYRDYGYLPLESRYGNSYMVPTEDVYNAYRDMGMLENGDDEEYLFNELVYSYDEPIFSFESLQAAYDANHGPGGYLRPNSDEAHQQMLLLELFEETLGFYALYDDARIMLEAASGRPLPDSRVPQGESADLSTQAYQLCRHIESRLAEHVKTSLIRAFGSEDWWVEGIPKLVRQKAAQIQEQDDCQYAKEKYMFIVGWHETVLKNWNLFQNSIGKATRGEGKGKKACTGWIVEFNDIRNKVSHHRGTIGDHEVEQLKSFLNTVKTASTLAEKSQPDETG